MSLKDVIGVILDANNILNYQLNRDKTHFNEFDDWFYGLFEHDFLQRTVLGLNKMNFGYYDGQVLKNITDYPELEGIVEYATAPHLLGRQEIGTAVLFLKEFSKNKFFYTLNTINNLSGILGPVRRPFFTFMGAFPVHRYNIRTSEIKTLIKLIKDEEKRVAVAINGTRSTSGYYSETYLGLEKALRAVLKKSDAFHQVVPLSMSFDQLTKEFYVTASNPVNLTAEDFKTTYKEEGSLIEDLKELTQSGMQVTYNHLASTYLLGLAQEYDEDFKLNKNMMYDVLEVISTNLGYREDVNFENVKDKKTALDNFIGYSIENGYLYEQEGNIYANVNRSHPTFKDYELSIIEKFNNNIIINKLKDRTYDDLTPSEKNHKNKKFRKLYPIQYMANLVEHRNLFNKPVS